MIRSVESAGEDALFTDSEAAKVAGEEAYAWFESLAPETQTEMKGMVAVRTRWIDDVARGAIDGECAQVVVVGSGLDTRYARDVYRPDTCVFELDFDEVLERMGHHVESSAFTYRRIPVSVDLSSEGLEALAESGLFTRADPTLWILEGVTGYLSEEAVGRTLRAARELSAAGSVLVSTFVGASRRAFGPSHDVSSQHTFATDAPKHVLEDNGWVASEERLGAVAARYRRVGLSDYDYWLCRATT